jgi:hypothetical protein
MTRCPNSALATRMPSLYTAVPIPVPSVNHQEGASISDSGTELGVSPPSGWPGSLTQADGTKEIIDREVVSHRVE